MTSTPSHVNNASTPNARSPATVLDLDRERRSRRELACKRGNRIIKSNDLIDSDGSSQKASKRRRMSCDDLPPINLIFRFDESASSQEEEGDEDDQLCSLIRTISFDEDLDGDETPELMAADSEDGGDSTEAGDSLPSGIIFPELKLVTGSSARIGRPFFLKMRTSYDG